MAGKGDRLRSVVGELFRSNHDFIFGVTASYRSSVSEATLGDDCALRGYADGKCWGQVVNHDVLEDGGDMVCVCQGHFEYFDWCANKLAARAYIPEQFSDPNNT